MTIRLPLMRCSLLVTAMLGTAVSARDWRSAGGWDIVETDAESCTMGMEYEGEGETTLLLVLQTDGAVYLGLTNYKWSTVPKQNYDLVYYLNGTGYSGGKSVGYGDGLRKGFLTSFEPDFLGHFAKSSYLTIKSEDGVLIDDLSLSGSAAGLSQLRNCVAHLRALAAADARERARFAHIPEDPFASVKGTPPAAATGAKPIANLSSLVSAEDYPASAIANGKQGRVRFRLNIGTDGRVTGCTIVESSGSAALDSATCNVMRRRARFTPARTANGTAVEGSVEDVVTWRL